MSNEDYFFNITYLIFISSYSFLSLICYFLDTSNIIKKIIYKHYGIPLSKINSKDIKFLESLYIKYLPRVCFNVFILSYFYGMFNLQVVRRFNLKLLENNSYETFHPVKAIIEYSICIFLTDFTFYTCHRISHHPYLYKYIHKKHHEVKNCIGMAGVYTDPIDYFFGNYVPVNLHTVLIVSHQYTFYLWILKTVYGVIVNSHSGFQNMSEYHDLHHTHFKYNFGIAGGYMDKIFGTEYPKKNLNKND